MSTKFSNEKESSEARWKRAVLAELDGRLGRLERHAAAAKDKPDAFTDAGAQPPQRDGEYVGGNQYEALNDALSQILNAALTAELSNLRETFARWDCEG